MRNKIFNCSNTKIEFKKNSFDMFITSPPYDNMRDYNGYAFDFNTLAFNLFAWLKDGGVGVWIVNDKYIKGSRSLTSFKQAIGFKEIGFNIHDIMIWDKKSTRFPSANRYYQSYEFMFILSKGKPKTHNLIKDRKNKHYGKVLKQHTYRLKDGTQYTQKINKQYNEFGVRFNIWNINAQGNRITNHPAVFPVGLIKDHILTWTNENDIVLDPFMGSGTTALACLETNRFYTGIEISKEYCELAEKRIYNK